MSSKFEAALKKTMNDEVSVTENGAVGFKTSGKALCDINFAVSSLRNASEEKILEMFQNAYAENPVVAVKWLFMARDIRGNGMGERRLFRVILKYLAQIRSDIVEKLVPVIADYGRFDDLWELADTTAWGAVVDLVAKQLAEDIKAKEAGKPITLLSKWLPSVNTSSPKTKALAKTIRLALGFDEKTYRKTLSGLRAYSNVVEVKASANNWAEINYDAVPSQANIKYKNAFLKNDEARRREWLGKLEKGEAKVNASTNFPSDIVHAYTKTIVLRDYSWNSKNKTTKLEVDPTLEAMWKALPNIAVNGNVIAVCDGSGSMTTRVSGELTALEVCNAFGIYCAEHCTGPFKDKYITFSERPKYVDMSKAKSLLEKLKIAYAHDEVANTNLEAVFNLILKTAVDNNLKQEDIPTLVILSDMEFDRGCDFGGGYWANTSTSAQRSALMEKIRQRWNAAGYKLPRLIWWNIASRTGTVPMQQNPETGMILCSGYSQSQFKMIASNKTDPYDVLLEALDVPRYAKIGELINGIV